MTEGAELRLYRVSLALVSVLLPALAVAYRLGAPENVDPTGERFAFGAVALGLLGGSYVFEPVRRHLQQALLAFLLVLELWVVYYAADSRFSFPDLVGLVVYQFAMLVVFPAPRHAVLTMGVLLGSVAVGLVWVGDPVVHPAFVLGLPTVLSVIGFVALNERARLLTELGAHRDQLEGRVAERTAQLEAEVAHRRRAEAEARDASEAKSAFLTRMSHELRTPINAMVGYTELVRDELEDAGQSEHVGDLERALDASRHLLRMVDDVLDLSRIEARRLPLRFVSLELADVVRRALDAAHERLSAVGCRVRVEASGQADLDGDRVHQVLVNLLDNAARFAPGSDVVVQARRDGADVTIEVIDGGPGMTPDFLTRVFEPFSQGDESSLRRQDGAGLGLAVSREIAERLGGTLRAESTPGTGSRFVLTVPSGGRGSR